MTCPCPDCRCDLPGRAASLWIDAGPATEYPPLGSALHVDVAVLGGGISGLTTAYLLQKAGLKVAVLEADRIVSRVSGFTTAKITALQESQTYSRLKKSVGTAAARGYAEGQQAALEQVASIVDELKIDCHFERRDTYLFATDDKQLQAIQEEAVLAKEYGLPCGMVDEVPTPLTAVGGVRCRNQAQFNPREYLLRIAKELTIFEQTRVKDIHDGHPCRIETNAGSLTADRVVLATHFPVGDHSWYSARLQPHSSYVLAIELDKELAEGMFISAETPEHTFRTYEGLLILTGEGHASGENPDPASAYLRLEQYAREKFPVKSIKYRWTTHDLRTVDHLPYIGRYSPLTDNLFVATGFGGWGMTNGTLAGMLLKDRITGRKNALADIFSPQRLNLATAGKVVVGGAKNISHVVSQLARKSESTLDDLRPGQGKVIKHDGKPVAVSKDHRGTLHAVSSACTHLGCTVAWNAAEGTWDCPCHGSRFKADGEVLYGPATEALATIKLKP